ncbi:hypothetical protein EON67_08700 [archaeon]|nr:MAG: hypothetical protein EON67_08700 [archaeon]
MHVSFHGGALSVQVLEVRKIQHTDKPGADRYKYAPHSTAIACARSIDAALHGGMYVFVRARVCAGLSCQMVFTTIPCC